MNKILYCFICIAFLSACKNDTKTTEATADSVITPQTQNTQVEPSSTEITNADGSTTSTTTLTDGTVTKVTKNTDGTITTTTIPAPPTNGAPAGQPITQTITPPEVDGKMILGKSKVSETLSTIIPDEDKNYGKDAVKLNIPDPCSLIGMSTLISSLGIKSTPEVKPGSKKPIPAEKSCFFRYEDPDKTNAGIMLQVMTNPYPNEIEDYPSLVISGKIKDGEQSPTDKVVKKFKPWNEVGDAGCYSYEAGKYHWRLGSKYVFMLAFNTSHNEAQQKQIAAIIGKEVMKNFKNK